MTDTKQDVHAGLEPCPFCGCTDVFNNDDGDHQWFECGWCHATSGYDPAPEFEERPASFHWNRRAALTGQAVAPVSQDPAWWIVPTLMGKAIFHGPKKERAERIAAKNGCVATPLYAAPVQAPVEPVGGLVTDALNEALKLAKLAATLTGCRGDDDYVWGVQAKIEAALAAISQGGQP